MAKGKMVQWSGQRIEFVGWWVPGEGETICGVLLQRAPAGGRFNQAHYVIELTEATSANPFGTDESKMFEPGSKIGVPDNYNLGNMAELIGYEVEITCTQIRQFEQYGEQRSVKQFKVLHSEKVVRPDVAKQYGQKTAQPS